MPDLVKVAGEFADRGGKVIAISQDLFAPNVTEEQALASVKRLAGQLGMRFPVFILKDKTLDALNEHFNLPGPIPCTIALDASGKEVDREEEEAGLERFRAMMQRALQ